MSIMTLVSSCCPRGLFTLVEGESMKSEAFWRFRLYEELVAVAGKAESRSKEGSGMPDVLSTVED